MLVHSLSPAGLIHAAAIVSRKAAQALCCSALGRLCLWMLAGCLPPSSSMSLLANVGNHQILHGVKQHKAVQETNLNPLH